MSIGLSRPALALGLFGCVAAAGALTPMPAAARGGFAFGIGLPLFPPPVVYAPPPAYYVPPPPMVYMPPPPPPYAATAPAPAAATAAPAGQTCREYKTTAIIDGKPQPTYGTACLQPDGTWRIVR